MKMKMKMMITGWIVGIGGCLFCGAGFGQVIGGIRPIVTSNPTISTLTTGVVLDVTPSISADGRYVTMNIHPSFSSLDGFQTFNLGNSVQNGFGGTIGGSGLRAFGVVPIPFRPAQVGKVVFVENDKKLLALPVAAMSLKGVTLQEAARKLAAAEKCNIVVGVRGLEQAGVKVADVHDFAIEKGTMKDALLAMLKVAAPESEMVITVEDGVVQVTTQAQADNVVITRTYYLEDLLANLPRVVSNQTDLETLKPKTAKKEEGTEMADVPKELGPAGVLPPAVGGAGRSSISAKLAEPDPRRPAVAEKAPEKISTNIAEIITSSVRPEIWKNNGGKIGEIAVVGDRVTITAPASVHAILEGPKHYNPSAAPVYVNTSGL